MQDEAASATQEAQQTRAKAKASASAARDEVRQTAADVQDELASAAENVKGQVGDIGNAVEQRARAIADDKKAAGAMQLSGLARAINHAADELQSELPQAATNVRQAAAKIDSVSTMIRERNIEELMHEANDFARTNTVAFFGLSLAAGFALARFVKSGAPSASQPMSAAHHAETQPHPASVPPERFATAASSQF